MMRTAVLLLVVALSSGVRAEPPADYQPPAPIAADRPFWRVHRFDLEQCATARVNATACVVERDACRAARLEDVTDPPEPIAMSWWQAGLAAVVTIVATIAAKKGIDAL